MAGLSLKVENLPAFILKFEEVVSATIEEYMLTPEIEIDAEINLDAIDPKFFRILKQFAPFGPGNMAPVFLTKNVCDKGYVRIVGAKHLKMDVLNPGNTTCCFPAIGFNLSDHYTQVLSKKAFNVCYAVEENEYRGNVSLQLNVKDIKFINQ